MNNEEINKYIKRKINKIATQRQQMSNEDLRRSLDKIAKRQDSSMRRTIDGLLLRYRLSCAVEAERLTPANRAEHEDTLVERRTYLEGLITAFDARLN